MDPNEFDGNEFLGYIHIVRTPNGGIYYNFYPIAEIDVYSGSFVTMSYDMRVQDFPQFGNINIYTSNLRAFDLGRRLKNGKLYIIGIDDYFKSANYNSSGALNQTEEKIDLKDLIDNQMFHNVYDEPYGYYQVFDIPNLSEIISSGRSIILPLPLSDIIPSEYVMLRDQGNRLIGPFQVKEEKQRGEINYSYVVDPEGKKNHYIFDAYDGSFDPKAFVTVRYDAMKGETTAQTELVNITKLPKRKMDYATDVLLFQSQKEDYENKQEGRSDHTHSLLLSPDIPADIARTREARVKALVQQNLKQNQKIDNFMDLMAKSLLEKIQNNDEFSNDLITALAENPDFMNGISGNQIFRDAKQEKQKDFDDFCADVDAKKVEKEKELDALDAEISKMRSEQERLRQEAIKEDTAKLEDIRGQYDKIVQAKELAQEELDELTEKLGLEKSIEILRYENNKTRNEKDLLEKQVKDLTKHFEKVTDETLSRMADIKINEHIARALTSAASGEPAETDTHTEMKNILRNQIEQCRRFEKEDNELIQKLTDFFKTYRISYPVNDILNLYICFTQGFLTVLSGAPGTGKTTACSILAHSLGMDRTESGLKTSRFITVPVERGWSSKRDLIGYYNPLTKEFDKSNQQVYRALEFSDAECEIDDGQKIPPMAILLDEANLSQMEYYWASFMNVGDHSLGESLIDLGNGKSFRISDSLRFLATINNDHTTESLSPRLIDRAWVITLPDSTQYRSIDFSGQEDPVSLEQLQRIFGVSADSKEEMDLFSRSILSEMYRLCNSVNMSLSLRTKGAIRNYCIAGHNVFMDDPKNAGRKGGVIAADFAIAQKILPKIQGQGPAYKERVLDEFKQFFDKNSLTKSSEILDRIIREGDENMNFYRFFG